MANQPSQTTTSTATAESGATQPDARGPAALDPETLAHAEQMLDELGRQFGQWSFAAGRRLRILIARAREEAEDVWAEAQVIRRGGPRAD
jgi:hypothetical protein